MNVEDLKIFVGSQLYEDMKEIVKLPTFDLSTEKGRADKKEMGLNNLLEVGYITPDKKEAYAKELQELPTDRKGLVVAYFLENADKDIRGTADFMERGYKLLQEYGFTPMTYRAALSRGKTETSVSLADIIGYEASQEYKAEYARLMIEERIQIAELFVDTKRKRIKNSLQTFALWLICDELIAEETELDPIVTIRENLERNGYNPKGKSLNDTDKKALEDVARAAVGTLELAYLNGILSPRVEEINGLQDENGAYKENFIYRDLYDEVISVLDPLPSLFVMIWGNFYNASTPKEILGALKELQEKTIDPYTIRLKGTKFETLIK